MKALRVARLTDDFAGVALADLSDPERAPGEVLVRVRAASLNFPDLLMTRGAYQFKPDPPFTSGMELAGEVIEADPDTGFAVGDRVMGGAKTGGFAEFASVPGPLSAPCSWKSRLPPPRLRSAPRTPRLTPRWSN